MRAAAAATEPGSNLEGEGRKALRWRLRPGRFRGLWVAGIAWSALNTPTATCVPALLVQDMAVGGFAVLNTRVGQELGPPTRHPRHSLYAGPGGVAEGRCGARVCTSML
jgi:hypothetical protein